MKQRMVFPRTGITAEFRVTFVSPMSGRQTRVAHTVVTSPLVAVLDRQQQELLTGSDGMLFTAIRTGIALGA